MTPPDRSSGSAEPVPVDQLSFSDASRELDAIVEFFEQREVDVDLLVGRLERATAIVDELDRRIRRTRAQVEELVPKLEAAARPEADDGTEAQIGIGRGGTDEDGDTGEDGEDDEEDASLF